MEEQIGSYNAPFELEFFCPLFQRFHKTPPFKADVRGDEILACSKRQCPTCISLKWAADKAIKNYDATKGFSKEMRLQVIRKTSNGVLQLPYGLHYDFRFLNLAARWFSDKDFEVCGLLDDAGTDEISRQGKLIASTPASGSCFRLLKSCLQNCDSEHVAGLCVLQKSDDNTTGPARLLHIVQTQNQLKVKLVPYPGLGVQYTTLSYCWGQGETLTTTRENYIEHSAGIKVSTLPQTLQDAIKINDRLDIKYIWIDALCIIQQDVEDWAAEAAKMATIFEQSYLTISATSSTGAVQGFLAARKFPDIFLGSLVSTRWKMKVYVREVLRHISLHPEGRSLHLDFARHEMVEPVQKRGWCLQERLLSRRIIHYCSGEVIWECCETIACECGYFDAVHSLDKGGLQKYVRPATLMAKQEANPNPRLLGEHWIKLVSQYSAMNLTEESDILPAIAGLATNLQQKGLGQYLAGLWENDIAHELVWIPDETSKRPKKYRAPSWSWASIVGPVTWGHSTRDGVSGIRLPRPPQISLLGPNPFCEVSNAELILSGRIIQGKFHYKEDPFNGKHIWFSFPSGNRMQIRLDIILTAEEIQRHIDSHLYVLRVLINYSYREEASGLVLKQNQDMPDHFQRIGSFYRQPNSYFSMGTDHDMILT